MPMTLPMLQNVLQEQLKKVIAKHGKLPAMRYFFNLQAAADEADDCNLENSITAFETEIGDLPNAAVCTGDMVTKADYLTCLLNFTTEQNVTDKRAAIAYVHCYKKCYGFEAEVAADVTAAAECAKGIDDDSDCKELKDACDEVLF